MADSEVREKPAPFTRAKLRANKNKLFEALLLDSWGVFKWARIGDDHKHVDRRMCMVADGSWRFVSRIGRYVHADAAVIEAPTAPIAYLRFQQLKLRDQADAYRMLILDVDNQLASSKAEEAHLMEERENESAEQKPD